MRLLDLGHVELDAEAGLLRHLDEAAFDLQRLFRQALAVLPDPVRVDRRDAAGRRRADVGEHRQRDVEVVVRVRAPGQAPVAAGLGDAHRAGHRPEVRIGERDVDRLQRQRMAQLAPVGGDHVGRRRQAGGAAELGHHLAAREAVLGAARVLGVGDDAAHVAHQADRVLEQPAAVRIERDARAPGSARAARRSPRSPRRRASAPPFSLKSLKP